MSGPDDEIERLRRRLRQLEPAELAEALGDVSGRASTEQLAKLGADRLLAALEDAGVSDPDEIVRRLPSPLPNRGCQSHVVGMTVYICTAIPDVHRWVTSGCSGGCVVTLCQQHSDTLDVRILADRARET